MCTIINICCLEAIIDHYIVTSAKNHISDYKKKLDSFCKKINAEICPEQSFEIASPFSHHLICETIEFVVEWKINERTLRHIEALLSKSSKIWQNLSKSEL